MVGVIVVCVGCGWGEESGCSRWEGLDMGYGGGCSIYTVQWVSLCVRCLPYSEFTDLAIRENEKFGSQTARLGSRLYA